MKKFKSWIGSSSSSSNGGSHPNSWCFGQTARFMISIFESNSSSHMDIGKCTSIYLTTCSKLCSIRNSYMHSATFRNVMMLKPDLVLTWVLFFSHFKWRNFSTKLQGLPQFKHSQLKLFCCSSNSIMPSVCQKLGYMVGESHLL